MSETTRLALPLLAAAQAQKHVTHNEALLRLDALSHPRALSRQIGVPPSDPQDGDCYLVATSASGDWAGEEGNLAFRQDGFWQFFGGFPGLQVFIEEEGICLIFNDGDWQVAGDILSHDRLLARSPFGAEIRFAVYETLIENLAGASVASPTLIPNRAIVFGVSSRTVEAVTGATSYDCGIVGEPSKFGGSLGVAAGSTNAGVIGPTAFYADTALVLTANGGSFTGGSVRLAVQCFVPVVPQA